MRWPTRLVLSQLSRTAPVGGLCGVLSTAALRPDSGEARHLLSLLLEALSMAPTPFRQSPATAFL